MNLDGSRWTSCEWIATILALGISMLTYIYVYAGTLQMEPETFPSFLVTAATFLFLDWLLHRMIAPKASFDRKM